MDRILSDDDTEEVSEKKPRVEDFDAYVPWACTELRLDVTVIIDSITLEKPTGFQLKSAKSRMKAKTSAIALVDIGIQQSDHDSFRSGGSTTSIMQKVRINATHDPNGNLISIKFLKNPFIPCQVFKLIEVIHPYHRFLTSITINDGLDNHSLHQLTKIINFGLITDLCLDNAAILGGWYDLILEKRNKLLNLSLARCRIEDDAVKKIASLLVHSAPASYTLQTLNLASNNITDEGARALGIALRSNRRLAYLNLCDNKISDDGVSPILDALSPFLVTADEIMLYRRRKLQYIKEREHLTNLIIQELKCTDFDKKISRKAKPLTKKAKEDREHSMSDMDALWYDKAKSIAEDRMGEFIEPFAIDKRFKEDDLSYSYGNNILAYLNVSYNHLSYMTVKKLVQVLIKQQELKRKPIGLANVVLEGNNVPGTCVELDQIDAILLSNVPFNPRKQSLTKIKK